MRMTFMFPTIIVAMFMALPALASDVQFKAESAVADILFEFDGSETYAAYVVGDDGFVDITFARNIPDELYSDILQRLKDDERISGVLAGTSGPSCSLF